MNSSRLVERVIAAIEPAGATPLADLGDSVIVTADGLRDFLDALAERTQDPSIARAARAMRQQSPGRPAIDDAAALREVSWLLTEGHAKSFDQAAKMVARTYAPHMKPESFAERLRGKRAAQK